MTIGYFSPLPPSPSGVADYSAALLPHLERFGTVLRNSPGMVNLYHIGNNQLHAEIYRRALAEPGIVVLHDAVLQHLFLGSLDRTAYIEEFVHNYGEWSRGEAEDLWRRRARSGADARYFARPILRRLLESAKAIVVHNPAAAQIAREHAPAARLVEIPHLLIPPPPIDAVDTLRLRQTLGLHPRTLLVGAFGHQRETKRLHILVRAFERALTQGANARLLISGEFVSPTLAAGIDPYVERLKILRTGHLPEQAFWRYLAATDLCVNLRYPSAAESSGVAIRMMGLGKAVAFTRDAATDRFPDNACLRIDVGGAEEQMLADYIAWLAGNPGSAEAIGRSAAQYVARVHDPARAAELYWNALSNT